MKNKSNQKVVGAVRKFVADAAIKANKLEKKGVAAMARVEGAWGSTKPRRDKILATAKGVMKHAERKTNEIVRKTVQTKNDITMGIRQGIKDAKKAVK